MKILFSSATPFVQIFQSGFRLENPDGMILKELCMLFLAFCDLTPCSAKDLLLVPKVMKSNGD